MVLSVLSVSLKSLNGTVSAIMVLHHNSIFQKATSCQKVGLLNIYAAPFQHLMPYKYHVSKAETVTSQYWN